MGDNFRNKNKICHEIKLTRKLIFVSKVSKTIFIFKFWNEIKIKL